METKKIFKPFDKVLARMKDEYGVWIVDFYSHQKPVTKYHVTIGFNELEDDDILPYKRNEHLVGTTDSPDEEVKLEEGECIIAIDKDDLRYNFDEGFYGKVVKFRNKFIERNGKWGFSVPGGCNSFAIRFSDFNPEDMEETKKHILCVKNGKVVRYKG